MATRAVRTKRFPTGAQTEAADSVAEERSHNWLQPVSTCLLVGVIAFIAIAGGGYVAGMWRFATIDTGSMRPVMNPGDVAILRPEPLNRLHIGQVVAFHPPGDANLTVIHRVVAIDHQNGAAIIQTKGDANNARDQWKAHIEGNTVWYEAGSIPKIGYVVVLAQMKIVRLVVLAGILALVLSMALRSLWRREDSPTAEGIAA